MLNIGDKAPAFEGKNQNDETISLADFNGKTVVLYFYPKDNTPGCTTEGQDFRDLYPLFNAAGADILGVSRDTLRTHENFRNKHSFPFHLLSDGDEKLCKQFDVIKEKKLYGRTYMGIERSTFLIDPEGVLQQEWRKVRVPGHAQAVLDALKAS